MRRLNTLSFAIAGLICSAVLVCLLAPRAVLAKTFICEVKSAATFTRGTLAPIDNEKYWLGIISTVTFDEDTGLLKYGSGNNWEQFTMTVLQRGTDSNDTLAAHSEQGAVRYLLNTLRIRSWEVGAPFVWTNEGDFFVGNCAPQGN